MLAGLAGADQSERVALYALVGWPALFGAATSRWSPPLLWRWVGVLSVILLLLLSGWATYALYTNATNADEQHWNDFAADVAEAAGFGWPILTYPVDPPVTADLLDAYRPGVLSQTRMSITSGQHNTLPTEVAQGGTGAVWLASVESPGSEAIASQFRDAGYRQVLKAREKYDLHLDLYLRDGAQIGTSLPVNGTFQEESAGAGGWQLPPTGGATFSPTDDGGRQLTLKNDTLRENIVWEALPADPEHLYLLNFEARADLTSGEAKAFLICATAQGDWPLVAPNAAGQPVPNDRAWHKIDITALCPIGTGAVRIDLRNVGRGEADYRQVELQDAAPR